MVIAAARRVKPAGHVFATEIEPKRLAEIRSKAAEPPLTNLSVIESMQAGGMGAIDDFH